MPVTGKSLDGMPMSPFYAQVKESAVKPLKKSTEKIFENIIFLAEVFGDRANAEIPPLPVLEMARCFELVHPRANRGQRRRRKDWPLWN